MPSQPLQKYTCNCNTNKILNKFFFFFICQVDELLCYYCIYKAFPHRAYVILIIAMYFVRFNQFIYFKDVCAILVLWVIKIFKGKWVLMQIQLVSTLPLMKNIYLQYLAGMAILVFHLLEGFVQIAPQNLNWISRTNFLADINIQNSSLLLFASMFWVIVVLHEHPLSSFR